MATVSCPECSKKLKVADTSIGKKVKCTCGNVFVAESDAAPNPAGVPAPALTPEKVYVACTECNAKLKVATTSLGKRMKCPNCKAVFTASIPEGAAAPPPKKAPPPHVAEDDGEAPKAKAKAKPAVSDDDMDDLLNFAHADADADKKAPDPLGSLDDDEDERPRPKGKAAKHDPDSDQDDEPKRRSKGKPGKPTRQADKGKEEATDKAPVYPRRTLLNLAVFGLLALYLGFFAAIFLDFIKAEDLGIANAHVALPKLKGDNHPPVVQGGKDKEKADAEELANKKEAAKFHGVWIVVSADGPEGPVEMLKGKKYFFAEGMVTTPESVEGPYSVDASREPKWLNLPAPAKGPPLYGIYQLDGDTLQWCTHIPSATPKKKGQPPGPKDKMSKEKGAKGRPETKDHPKQMDRPKQFDASQGLLVVLTREKKADTTTPPELKKDNTKIDGAWIIESAVKNGKADAGMKGEPLVFADGKAIGMGPTPVPYTVDAGTEPNSIDVMVNPKLTLPGIFKLDGDNLQLGFSGKSLERPKDFAGQDGMAATFRRATKEDILYSRTSSQNHLKHIGLAIHSYHDKNKGLPPAGISDAGGKPLLSWRVAILPYLGEETAALYKEFDLEQPWDCPQNKALIAKMPQVYVVPMLEAKDGLTHYRALVGPGTVLEPKKGPGGKLIGRQFVQIPDGTSNTIMVVEAKEPTIWTKPDDLPYDPDGALPKFGVSPIGFNVLLTDAVVLFVRPTIPDKVLRPYLTGNNGMPREPLDPDAIKRKDDFKDFKDKDFKDKDFGKEKDKDSGKDKDEGKDKDDAEAKIMAAKAQIAALGKAVQAFRIKNGVYPDSLQDLVDAKPAYVASKDALIDPWKKTFNYDPTGAKNNGDRPDIWTIAPDQTVIGNWAPAKKEE